MSASFRLGMGQMLVQPGQPDRNLARAVEMIRRAADEGCRIVVLPECLDLGWTHPSAARVAVPIPGERSRELSVAACANGIYVVAGLTEREGDQVYNAAVCSRPPVSCCSATGRLTSLILRPLSMRPAWNSGSGGQSWDILR